MSDHIISIKQAANFAGKDERTIRRWIRSGLIRDHRPAGDKGPIRIDEVELRAYLAGQVAPAMFTSSPGSSGPFTAPMAPDILPADQIGVSGQNRLDISPARMSMTELPGENTAPHGAPFTATPTARTAAPAARMSGALVGMSGQNTSGGVGGVGGEVARELRSQVAMLQDQVADLRRERDRLVVQVEGLTDELNDARRARVSLERELIEEQNRARDERESLRRELVGELNSARDARAAVERELAGREGIRGLLKAIWK